MMMFCWDIQEMRRCKLSHAGDGMISHCHY